MKLNNLKFVLVILFIFNLSNYAYAAKNNVISELYVFSKDNKTFKEKIKNLQRLKIKFQGLKNIGAELITSSMKTL